jgi:aminoglycoside 6'-N-acetyltransferase I
VVEVRHAAPADAGSLARLRHALWPDGSEAEHRQEVERFLADPCPKGAILVAAGKTGLVGFAEVSIRAYAEGCRTDRVGYLEGWFVETAARRHGVGRQLVTAAEAWARSQGCAEFASDAEADNDSSAAAHRALGFAEVGLIRCFRKDLLTLFVLTLLAHNSWAQTPKTEDVTFSNGPVTLAGRLAATVVRDHLRAARPGRLALKVDPSA